MNKSNNNQVRIIFRWWIEQLASFIPHSLKAKIDENKCTVEIVIKDGEWVISAKGRNNDIPKLASMNTENENCSNLLNTWLTELSDPPSRLKIKIPSDHFLLREIKLPIAAETTLHEALEFQIGRVTPFRLEDIYYHYGIKAKDRAEKTLTAWLVVIPKRTMDPLLAAFNDLAPQPLTPSISTNKKIEPFTISYRLQTIKSKAGWLTQTAVALLLINLLGLAIYAKLHLNNVLLHADTIHTQLKEVKSKAMKAMDITQQLEELDQQAEFIGNLDHAALMKVAIIEDLTKKIPDHTWIKQLDIKNGQVTLVGYSDDSAGLVGQLEKSSFLHNVGFKSTVIRDRISGKERFSLSAKLIKPEHLKTDNSKRDNNKDESTDGPQG